MITCSRLGHCGRLGNQLWQLASTAGIAHTLGTTVGFKQNWDYQQFFRVPAEFWSPGLMVPDVTEAHETPLVDHIDPSAREYLQDYNLWKDIDSQIWNWLQPSDLALETLNTYAWFFDLPRPILSVHVRRGDNAIEPNNCHPVRPMSFYDEAIESLGGQFASICIFSDDPEWCRSQFSRYAVEYPVRFFVGTPRAKEHEPAYKTGLILDWIDLQMMSLCDRHIISNSTYSWWGAFLSHDLTPIYPTPWFGTDLPYIDASLMFPEGWHPIDHGQQYV